jgi:hypothetical protein
VPFNDAAGGIAIFASFYAQCLEKVNKYFSLIAIIKPIQNLYFNLSFAVTNSCLCLPLYEIYAQECHQTRTLSYKQLMATPRLSCKSSTQR